MTMQEALAVKMQLQNIAQGLNQVKHDLIQFVNQVEEISPAAYEELANVSRRLEAWQWKWSDPK